MIEQGTPDDARPESPVDVVSSPAGPSQESLGVDSARAKAMMHRTRVGATLAIIVAALMGVAALPIGDLATLVIGVVLGVGAAREVRRMRALVDDQELGAVIVAVFAAALAMWGALDPGSMLYRSEATPAARYWTALGLAAVAILALGSLAYLPKFGSSGRGAWARWPRFIAIAYWIALSLPGLFLVRHDLGVVGLVVVLTLSKVGDIAAYYVGNVFGRRFPHHPFPRVSPNKTTVGCLGSLVAAILVAVGVHAAGGFPPARFGVLSAVLAGAVLNVAAQAGDLLESALKREAGVKDSGTWFGPSGGLLDLVDSLLLAVPAVLLVWPQLFDWPYGG